MDWSAGLSWLTSLSRRREESAADSEDHADMGTAFGLDASLEALDPTLPSADASPAPVWQHPLNRRSRA